MSQDLAVLEAARSSILTRIARLHDMRPGSLGAAFRRCGKSMCHCADPDDPGHGPQLQFTCKINGKTHTETLPDQASLEKVKNEIAEYRSFEQLSRELVEVNQQICQARPRPATTQSFTAEEKKRLMRSIARSRGK
ncbi:MAG: DUF6788 family protein [Bryobacteraceae bacterium]|nr:DUF6788 family protein [Bryobacteraceae bacterium]